MHFPVVVQKLLREVMSGLFQSFSPAIHSLGTPDLGGPFCCIFVGWQMLCALSVMQLRTPVVVLGGDVSGRECFSVVGLTVH